MTWIEQFAKDHAQKPEPLGRALVIELDEMWHYLKKLDRQSWLLISSGESRSEIGDGQNSDAWASRSRGGSGADSAVLSGLRTSAALPLRQPAHGGDARWLGPPAAADPAL
jgi:hypothetical protein